MDLILNQHLIKSLNIIKYNHKIIFYRMVQKCNQNCNSKNKVKQRYFTTIFKSKVNEKLWRRRNIQSKNHVWVQLHVI